MNTPEQSGMFDALTCDPMELIERASEEVLAVKKWPQRMAEFFAVEEAYNLRRGMSAEDAARDAAERVVLLADYIGGRVVYLPTGEQIRRAARDAVMFRLEGRMSIDEMARRFDMSVANVYNILATQRRLYKERLQGRLFDDATHAQSV